MNYRQWNSLAERYLLYTNGVLFLDKEAPHDFVKNQPQFFLKKKTACEWKGIEEKCPNFEQACLSNLQGETGTDKTAEEKFKLVQQYIGTSPL